MSGLDSEGAFASIPSANNEVNVCTPFVSTALVSVPAVLYQHFIDHGSDSSSTHNPVRTPSVINLRLISVSTQTIIDRKDTLRWISKKWSSSLNSSCQMHLIP